MPAKKKTPAKPKVTDVTNVYHNELVIVDPEFPTIRVGAGQTVTIPTALADKLLMQPARWAAATINDKQEEG